MNSLQGQSLTLSYHQQAIIEQLDVDIPKGKITVFVGSNGCGKSTLLKAFARLIHPKQGQVILNGTHIQQRSTAQVAKELSILPQSPQAPESMSVYQLVCMGRYPHQNWLKQWSITDEEKVMQALRRASLLDLKDRSVDSLSGGQRQRAWIAMTLAQDTDVILLDEPTTYLDLAHQIDVLDLLYDLNREEHKTIVMVLHDLNLACRYAHFMVAIADKRVFAKGDPADILDARNVRHIFGLDCHIATDPIFGTPMCIPFGKGNKRGHSAPRQQMIETVSVLS
ncbi:ABC transporter ATP-binding protein [Psychrobacter sp. AOP5-GZ1-6]|uniref:ABC transporter ATP-binding protein n=1 Tax=Psychrobacter TaxID=497 RepID=UPI003F9DC9C2